MSPAISPRCPSCGAPADPTRPLCRYCACRLATVACPECAALVSLDAHHCPRCGTALAVEAEGPSPFTCPEGHGPLERRALGDSVLHACPTCAGIWMEAAPFQALAEARELR